MTALSLAMLVAFCGDVVSGWIEQRHYVFPFKEEDWLRYLLPRNFVDGDRRTIMLTGPSTVRENLRYEKFVRAFPDYEVIQGGISLGTIEDVSLSLEYIREVYGDAALPDVIILGVSPRFVANIPEDRPFRLGINRYSQNFSVALDGTNFRLTPKRFLEGWVAKLRFLVSKGPGRLRTAILALWYPWLSDHPRVVAFLDSFFEIAGIFEGGILSHLEWSISPYKYRQPAMDLETLTRWLDAPDSWWQLVFDWDPVRDRSLVRKRFQRFFGIVGQYEILTIIVNMPERDILRDRYDRERYDVYLSEVMGLDENTIFMDLRDYLNSEEFWDAEHGLAAGSKRLTDEVIGQLKRSVASGSLH